MLLKNVTSQTEWACARCFCIGLHTPLQGLLPTRNVELRLRRKVHKKTEDEIIESLRPDYVDGITLLGGEPFEPENQRELVKLLRRIKKELPQKTVWSFSGYTYEELTGDSRAVCEVTKEMLSMLDVLVDGEFVEAKRNISLRFRGSENQRLIDMNKTRKEGKIVLWDK